MKISDCEAVAKSLSKKLSGIFLQVDNIKVRMDHWCLYSFDGREKDLKLTVEIFPLEIRGQDTDIVVDFTMEGSGVTIRVINDETEIEFCDDVEVFQRFIHPINWEEFEKYCRIEYLVVYRDYERDYLVEM
nr:hypothetical protein [Azospirillum argentinense]